MGTAALAVTPTATRTTLSVSTEQLSTATETVFTGHVTDVTGAAVGDGSVSFETEAGSLGSASVDAEGNASVSITRLPAAADNAALRVRAVYHPVVADESLAANEEEVQPSAVAASVSAVTTVQSDATGVADFTITANPSTVTAKAGLSATTALTITPVNGFSEQVTLSCSGLPAQGTCTFSPVINTTANGAFVSTLQVGTQGAAGALGVPDFGISAGRHTALAWLLPGALALAGFASLRRRALRGLSGSRLAGIALLLVAGGIGLGGCSERYGYNHHPPSVATGTPVGSYTLNIAASGNNGSFVTTHNISVVLQVQ